MASSSVPRWYFELRRWKHTYYSLSYDTAHDEDNDVDDDDDDEEDEEKNGTLDVMIFFNYTSGAISTRRLSVTHVSII